MIASLANKIGCPVVTGDSDFFVTNVTYGVLPLHSTLSKSRKWPIYFLKNFVKHLTVKKYILPLIAVIMGNDYSTEDMLDMIQLNCGVRNKHGCVLDLNPRMQRIADYLRPFKCKHDAILGLSGGDKLNVTLKESIELMLKEFDVEQVNDERDKLYKILIRIPSEREKKLSTIFENTSLEEEFIKSVCYYGLADPGVLDIYYSNVHFTGVQCEDVCKKSSCVASDKIRFRIYTLLQSTEIHEYKRIGHEYKCKCIDVERSAVDLLTYKKIDKQKIFFDLIGCCDLKLFESQNISENVLYLISLKYWIQQMFTCGWKVCLEEVQALVVCFLLLNSTHKHSYPDKEPFDLNVAHKYSAWQSILFYMHMLNTLLSCPLPVLRISKIFNGTYAHNILKMLHRGMSCVLMCLFSSCILSFTRCCFFIRTLQC